MRIWIALLVAPLLALTDLTISFATVSWSCAHQNAIAMHVVHAAFFAATLACAAAAWMQWREGVSATGETPAQVHFLGGIGMASATLSSLVVLAMWMPVWVVASCIS
jgi:tellurite resistance protein TehA-like permease